MEKYLGNKRALLESIHATIIARAPDATSICDVFAGTTNVGRHFRHRGFDVISNDCNRFSFVLGAAYLATAQMPQFRELPPRVATSDAMMARLKQAFLTAVHRDGGLTFDGSDPESAWRSFLPLARVLGYLNELPGADGPLTEYFTRWGKKSAFTSLRGRCGCRNYFSRENAARLDAILLVLRKWRTQQLVSNHEFYVLLTALLEEVTIVANVNGTFHDFNRGRLFPNALQSLFLRVPLIKPSPQAARVLCGDALSIGGRVPAHDVLYLDPPYNFRQYTAYYHLLNFIAAYSVLAEPAPYLRKLDFVRGQNMDDDFASDFCFKDRFLEALGRLIDSMPSRYVCMSYYGGRNHWNHWSKTDVPTDTGIRLLRQFFRDRQRFNQCEVFPALQVRQNYQSRGGERKALVDEHFFFSEKRHAATVAPRGVDPIVALNRSLGLDCFGHYATGIFEQTTPIFRRQIPTVNVA